LFAALAVLALFLASSLGRADEEKIPLEKVPKPVLDAVRARFKNCQLRSAEKETENGKTVFDVAIKCKGQNLEVTVTTEGKVVGYEREISARDLPAVVAKALKTRYPNAQWKTVEEVYKVDANHEKLESYEIAVTTGNKSLEVHITPEGKFTSSEE
jgi:hypothetical protein